MENTSMKHVCLSKYFVGLLFTASTAFAQLPELALPSSASGNGTTSQFYAGATSDDGATYANNFAFDQAIDILGEIRLSRFTLTQSETCTSTTTTC